MLEVKIELDHQRQKKSVQIHVTIDRLRASPNIPFKLRLLHLIRVPFVSYIIFSLQLLCRRKIWWRIMKEGGVGESEMIRSGFLFQDDTEKDAALKVVFSTCCKLIQWPWSEGGGGVGSNSNPKSRSWLRGNNGVLLGRADLADLYTFIYRFETTPRRVVADDGCVFA